MPEYKLTEDGSAIVMQDGKPVVVGDDGNEYTVDALSANEKVRKANEEAKKFRQQAREAQQLAEKYKPLAEKEIDPDAALDAVTKLSTLDEKMQADMEKLKTTLNQTWEQKLQEKEQAIEDLNQKLFKTNVLARFGTSPVAQKLILPPDIAAEYFGKFFNPDGTAKDAEGNTIYSKKNPGDPADFDEALEILIEQHPSKDAILKGEGTQGAGGHQGGGGQGGGAPATARDKISAGLKERGVA